jgi:hypothetical protein
MRLYARNIRGGIKTWEIIQVDDTHAIILSGLLGGNFVDTTIYHPEIQKEIASRIAKKRKEGYVSLEDIKWTPYVNMEIPNYLENNLPRYNTDANNNLKPMKCQPFKEKSMQYPAIIQPKLNGLRAVIRWEEWIEGEGMFTTKVEGAKIRTKEGLEYVLPHITNQFEKKDFFEDGIEYVFDGELYKHGMPLNEIKASCPMTNSRGTISTSRNDPSEIEFHIFDLAIPDMPQQSRITKLSELELVRNKIVIVTHDYIYTDKEAYERRDIAINNGYEGIVIRNIHEEYAFGFRPSYIRKFKTHIDSEFLIVDLISKPSDPTLPLFVLKNDINDYTFECNPTGKFEYQRELLINKETLVGKYATVRYRERTGTIEQLPFHANVVDIRDKK